MAFSFFRRKGEEPPNTVTPPKPVVPKPPAGQTAAPAQQPAAAPTPAEPEFVEFDDLSYDVSSATAELHSAVEEAAILYANDRIVEATAVLMHFVKENTESRDLHPWLLLFDLYQTQSMKAQFDDLSMEFIVRFERSAPVWEGRQAAAVSKAPAAKKATTGGVQFKGQVGSAAATEIESLLGLAEREGGVKLDLTGMTGIEPDIAQHLAAAMQKIRRGEKRLTVSGAREALQTIKSLLEGTAHAETRYWALLFELYQVLGMQAEFEDAAVDYAVTFELSPPSWEATPETVQAAAAEQADAPQQQAAAFVIEGVLGSGTDHKLGELERYAAERTDVLIDMTHTTRVDFMTIGAFIGTLSTVNAQGKPITIVGANEMLQALFAVMGVHEYATVQSKKAR